MGQTHPPTPDGCGGVIHIWQNLLKGSTYEILEGLNSSVVPDHDSAGTDSVLRLSEFALLPRVVLFGVLCATLLSSTVLHAISLCVRSILDVLLRRYC